VREKKIKESEPVRIALARALETARAATGVVESIAD
jgi:hypothetical protein